MSEPVVTRERIVEQVRHAMSLGTEHIVPYPEGSDAAAAWLATVARLKSEHPESEGSA